MINFKPSSVLKLLQQYGCPNTFALKRYFFSLSILYRLQMSSLNTVASRLFSTFSFISIQLQCSATNMLA